MANWAQLENMVRKPASQLFVLKACGRARLETEG